MTRRPQYSISKTSIRRIDGSGKIILNIIVMEPTPNYPIRHDVKDDPAMNVKVLEATDAYIQNSVKLTELTFLMKELTKTYRLSSTNLSNLVELPREANILDLLPGMLAMMTEIFCAFKGKPFSTPSRSVPVPTLALIDVTEAEVQIKWSKDSLKHQDSHLQVLTRAHNEKLKRRVDLRKKRFDQYVWIVNNRYKPDRITDIFIHPRTKPVTMTVYKNNDPRNFEVHREFKFGEFGLSE
ncbi:hypothetical protein Tco_0551638 [Tanacetum coccineum]